jgi:hypothetical protein
MMIIIVSIYWKVLLIFQLNSLNLGAGQQVAAKAGGESASKSAAPAKDSDDIDLFGSDEEVRRGFRSNGFLFESTWEISDYIFYLNFFLFTGLF